MDVHFKSLRDVLAESDDIDLPDDIRIQFNKTIKNFIDTYKDINATTKEDVSSFIAAVKALFNISQFAFSILSNILPFPIKIAVKVVTAVGSIVYSRQKMSTVLDGLADMLNYQLLSLCKKAVLKFQTCIVYCAGALKDISTSCDQLQTSTILSSLSSDAPIQTGLDEIGLLATQIGEFVEKGDASAFPDFMKKVRLHCLLSSLRELLLMFRLAMLCQNGSPISSILDVLAFERGTNDELLSFLFRPKRSSLPLHLAYSSSRSDWPMVESFLGNRHLQADDLPVLDMFRFQISSLAYPELQLSMYSSGIRGVRNSVNQDNEFTFQGGYGNVFLVRPVKYPHQYLVDCKMDSRREPLMEGFWKVVKIAMDSSEDTLCVVFVKAFTKDTCLYIAKNGKPFMKSFNKTTDGCFWNLQRLEERECDARNTNI